MVGLFLHETRRIWSRALPWGLFLMMTAFTLVFYWNFTIQNAAEPMEPLSVDRPMLAYFRPAPVYMEDYEATVALIEEATAQNQDNGAGVFRLEGTAGLNYRLFQLTQSGLLILGCLALGLSASDFEDSPASRRISPTRLLTMRSAVLFLTAALIFLVPRLLAAILAEAFHGGTSLEPLILFNPRVGPGLYDYFDGVYLAISRQRLVLAQSLTSVGQMFLRAGLYELLQIFAWTSLGLLLGRLFLRKYPPMVLTAFFLFLARSLSLPLNQFPPANFVFLIYQDALRDTLGSPDMIHGVAQSVYPLNYPLGLSVMLISGIFSLYLADLQLKGRLKRKHRGGDDDETI